MSLQPTLLWLAAIVAFLGLNLPRSASAGSLEMSLEAVLVWGTNLEKPANKQLKELETELARKMSKTPYKYKNYFEVDRKTVVVSANTTKRIVMSERCELEMRLPAADRIEVKLIGQGKPVSRHIEPLPVGQILILSGDDKDDNAWLIVLRQLPAKR
jgi:hypothetical protein